jgi:1-aminocyclopropane-1-carboxylate deaminase/D-cysteine desulfhydrase-like pyridoxal-dependent ACC family enzyme
VPKSFHATRNDYLLQSKVNLTFDETSQMSKRQFEKWVKSLKEVVVYAWDELGLPPKIGMTDEQIVADFRRLASFDPKSIQKYDQQTLDELVLMAPPNIGAGCLSFFPNIQKTKDISGNDLTGHSIYDLFTGDTHIEHLTNRLHRLFQTDKPYAFSRCVSSTQEFGGVQAKTGKGWIEAFAKNGAKGWDFWIDPTTRIRKDSKSKDLSLSKREIIDLQSKGLLKKKHLKHVDFAEFDGATRLRIRVYKQKQTVLEQGIRFFNTGLVQGGTNFPPTVAKFIYQHFTEDLKGQDRIVVYDPSAGFGGRLLGALSLNQDRHIRYVGTDPNPDNFLPEIDRTRYDYLGTYFNSHIKGKHQTEYDLFTLGSEVIHKDKRFQQYKGLIDFVFTSPPYFKAEGYSEDENQSYKKFPIYSDWRDGFLRKTLETAVEWLKPERYLAFNIADVAFSGTYLPLEQDTLDILEDLGMEYRGKYRMLTAPIPGGGLEDKQTRLPNTRNFAQVNGIWRKYEPIFFFWKPKRWKLPKKAKTKIQAKPSVSKYGVDELTPVQETARNRFYKRDDLFRPFGDKAVNGGKVRQSLCLVAENLTNIRKHHQSTIITQTSVHSPQGAIVASVAKELGLKAIICVGSSNRTALMKHPQMQLIDSLGAEIRIVAKHGMPNVLGAKIRDINATEHFFDIGFGMNVDSAYEALIGSTVNQVKNLPDELDYLVCSVGSGLQMAGILTGIHKFNKRIGKVVGVGVGPSRRKTIDRHLQGIGIEYDLIPPIAPYAKKYDEIIVGDGAVLDELYEAKAHHWMSNNLLTHYGDKRKHPKIGFWVIGCRI